MLLCCTCFNNVWFIGWQQLVYVTSFPSLSWCRRTFVIARVPNKDSAFLHTYAYSMQCLPQLNWAYRLDYGGWTWNYSILRPRILTALSYLVKVLVGQIVYRKMSVTLYGQGTARFILEEITKFKTEVWDGVKALLTASS